MFDFVAVCCSSFAVWYEFNTKRDQISTALNIFFKYMHTTFATTVKWKNLVGVTSDENVVLYKYKIIFLHDIIHQAVLHKLVLKRNHIQ